MTTTSKRVALAILSLAMLGAPAVADNQYRVIGDGLASMTISYASDPPTVHASFTGRLWHNYPGNPPTYFQVQLLVNGQVTNSFTLQLPDSEPIAPNMVITWTRHVDSGDHVEFKGIPFEQGHGQNNFKSFRFLLEEDVL